MYELAFHLTPDLEPTEVLTRVQEIQELITKTGATVAASREPRKIHLSYPLAHKHYAHFTVLDLEAAPDVVSVIDAQLKLHANVLRFLITKKPDPGKEVKSLAIHRIVKARPTMTARKGDEVKKKEATPGEQKQMEEDLAKALEKIS